MQKLLIFEKYGFLPLQFHPSTILGGSIQIDASMSSQYVSALMLIAPTLKGGLHIHFNELVSKDYVLMTSELMNYFGVERIVHENSIEIKEQQYIAQNISIESDWSSASYFFSMAALIPKSRLLLHNLTVYSLQGDSVCSFIATQLGAETHLLGDDIAVRNEECTSTNLDFDFKNCPDLVMTFAVLCAIKNKSAKFYNIQHLAHKESNRLFALKTELAKINCRFEEEKNYWKLTPTDFNKNESIEIETYNDHRIAMAFTPLTLVCKNVVIQNPAVVNKSFPTFWNEIEKLGIDIQKI